MIFNSVEFCIFLPIVFSVYWLVPNQNKQIQNTILLISSYIFYGWWDIRFLTLILLSSVVDFLVGLGLHRASKKTERQLLLFTSILVNLGVLGFFKYFNFFLDNFVAAFRFLGQPIQLQGLDIILPVGISFYTFQTLSYSIDLYRRKIKPTKNVIVFFTFVSFFPQLIAGPIERATTLLPQFKQKRTFDYGSAVDGMRQILWGFFKKMVIADNCAKYADIIFSTASDHTGSTLFLGVFFFAFQIYGDFSGYSDIAIGTSRLFGFNLTRNFAFPYFSRDIAEFWRRWHISLSSWFKDYVYIPLGGSRCRTEQKILNVFIIFLISGFWHGANWTFIAWGALNSLYFLPLLLSNKNRQNTDIVAQGHLIPSLKDCLQIGGTFLLTLIGWVFFRAESIKEAITYLNGLFSTSFFTLPEILPKGLLMMVLFFIASEWLQRDKQHGLVLNTTVFKRPLRWGIYYGICLAIFNFSGTQKTFIYFQF